MSKCSSATKMCSGSKADGGFGLFRGSVSERKGLYPRLARPGICVRVWQACLCHLWIVCGLPSETLRDGFLFPNGLDEDTGDWWPVWNTLLSTWQDTRILSSRILQIFTHSPRGHIYLFIAYDWGMKSWLGLGLGIGVSWNLWVGNVGRKDSNPFLSVTDSYSPHIDFFLNKGRIVMVSLIAKSTKVRIIGDMPLGMSLGEHLKYINWGSVAGGHLFIPAA